MSTTAIADPPPRRFLQLGALLLFITVTFATYWPTLHNGFIWDDDRYIQGNVDLLNLPGLGHIWINKGVDQYYPLTYTTFWLEYHFFQADPTVYHFDNLLLHFAVAITLWRILRRLRVPGAFVAALIFAIHPVQVESVAWATERKNVLSGLLYLLSLAAYLRTTWGRRITTDESPASTWPWYVLSLLLFFAALLSKTVTSTLPAAILLLVWWRRARIQMRDVYPLLPMFAAGAVMGRITSWIELHHVGAIGPEYAFTPIERICISGRALWFYLDKLIYPYPLAFIYSRWNFHLLDRAWLFLFPASAIIALVALWLLRHRLGRGPLTAALYFFGTLIPALGFFNVYPMQYSFVADHFQYLAAIGPIVLAAAFLARSLNRAVAIPMAIIAVIACHMLDYHQCNIYRDQLILWRDTLTKNPESAMVHINLGNELFQQRDIAGAEDQFREALRLAPDSAAPYLCLGSVASAYKDWPTAIRWYTRALDLMPDSKEPILRRHRAEPYFHIGLAYAALANRSSAAGDLASAARYRQSAIDDYNKAIDIIPDYELAFVSFGQFYESTNDLDRAIVEYRKAVIADPDAFDAHEALANALYKQRHLDQALAEYQSLLRIHPDSPLALTNIGVVLAEQGRLDDAIRSFQRALQSDPAFRPALQNLKRAQALQQSRRH